MKRFIISAAAVAALAMPAGASAQDQRPTEPPPPTCAPLLECVLDKLEFSISDPVLAACVTPVVTCVEQAMATAFAAIDNGVNRVEAAVGTVVDLVDDPPPVNDVCWIVYGEPCLAAITE